MSEQSPKAKFPTVCAIFIVILAITSIVLYTNQVGMQNKLDHNESELVDLTANFNSLNKDFKELVAALRTKKIGDWWYQDTDGDGKYDKAWQDNDGDIWADEQWEDIDKDGKWDKMKKDTDNDAKDHYDKGKRDTNGDGKFDQEWKDSNGNGKEDPGEWSDIDPEDMDDQENPPTDPEKLES